MRASIWSTCRCRTSGASASRCRSCGTSGWSCRRGSSGASWPSVPASRPTPRRIPAPSPGSTSRRGAPSPSSSGLGAGVPQRDEHDPVSAVRPIPPDEGGRPLFELPDELAIDTDVARRVISGFIRGQLAQAGFDKLVLGLSGGIDSALVAYLVAEAIGPERLLAVMMPYRTSSAASRGDAETIVADLGCQSDVVEITPMVDAYYGSGTAAVAEASALRRG